MAINTTDGVIKNMYSNIKVAEELKNYIDQNKDKKYKEEDKEKYKEIIVFLILAKHLFLEDWKNVPFSDKIKFYDEQFIAGRFRNPDLPDLPEKIQKDLVNENLNVNEEGLLKVKVFLENILKNEVIPDFIKNQKNANKKATGFKDEDLTIESDIDEPDEPLTPIDKIDRAKVGSENKVMQDLKKSLSNIQKTSFRSSSSLEGAVDTDTESPESNEPSQSRISNPARDDDSDSVTADESDERPKSSEEEMQHFYKKHRKSIYPGKIPLEDMPSPDQKNKPKKR